MTTHKLRISHVSALASAVVLSAPPLIAAATSTPPTKSSLAPNALTAHWTGPYGGGSAFDKMDAALIEPGREAAMAKNFDEDALHRHHSPAADHVAHGPALRRHHDRTGREPTRLGRSETRRTARRGGIDGDQVTFICTPHRTDKPMKRSRRCLHGQRRLRFRIRDQLRARPRKSRASDRPRTAAWRLSGCPESGNGS